MALYGPAMDFNTDNDKAVGPQCASNLVADGGIDCLTVGKRLMAWSVGEQRNDHYPLLETGWGSTTGPSVDKT